MSNYVNFEEFDDMGYQSRDEQQPQFTDNKEDDIKINSLYRRENKTIMFDDKTMLYYTALRKTHCDPFTLDEVDESIAFKFNHQWNPGNGDILDNDPYGPLYFHPDSLIKYFHTNLLSGLWVNEVEEKDGLYQGYYDSHVGAGEDIYIKSRGYNAEKYLFRLPIIDCYSIRDSPHLIAVTYGPKLTNDDIKLIDKLALKSGQYKYGAVRPNLYCIKKLYDTALSKTPELNIDISYIDPDQLQTLYDIANRKAVDILRYMI